MRVKVSFSSCTILMSLEKKEKHSKNFNFQTLLHMTVNALLSYIVIY